MYAVGANTGMEDTVEEAGAKAAFRASPTARLAGGLLLVATGSCLGAWISIRLGLSPLRITPGYALLLTGLLLTPARRWWLFLLAVLPAHFYAAAHFQAEGVPGAAMWCLLGAGVCQAVLGAVLVRRLVGVPGELNTLRGVMGFILLAVIAAPAISSVLAADLLTYIRWADDFWLTWRTRFLSNVFVTLTVPPLILLSVVAEPGAWRRIPLRRYAEGGVLLAATFAVGIIVFGIKNPPRDSYPLLLYAPLPLFLWAAVRFELRILSACSLIIASLSMAHASAGRGPFAASPWDENASQFQLYLLVISLPLTLLATVLQERRRAVAALRRSEQEARSQLAELSAIYRAAPTGLAFVDTELRYRSINDYLAEINRLPTTAHIGRSVREVLGDLADQVEPLCRSVIERRQPITDVEVRRQGVRGVEAERVWLMSHHPVENEQGGVLGVSAVVQEITARKRHEDTLRNIAAGVSAKTGETFFQSLAEHISSALQLEFAYICEVLAGGRRARTIATYVDGVPAGNVEYELACTPCEQVLQFGIAVYPEGVQRDFPQDAMLREMGVEGYLGICLKDSAGTALGLMAVLSRKPLANAGATHAMLTIFAARAGAELERKQAEDKLRASERDLRISEERYREVVESQTDLVCRYRADATLTFVNEAFCQFFGQSREKMIGRKFFEFIPEPGRAAAMNLIGALKQERRPLTAEHEVIRPDGSTGWQHWVNYAVLGPDGEVTEFQAIGRDITDRKRAEEANLKLAHASRLAMVGELTAMIAHDLSQPLSAMLCNTRAAELILDNSNRPPLKEIRAILADIRRDNHRAGISVDRMRTLLRQRPLELKPLNLSEVVAEVLQMTRAEALLRCVRIETEQSAEILPIHGDRAHLQQVLLNLILNGMDAMADMPESKRCLLIRTNQNGPSVEVAVTDAGRGILPERLPRMFESFFTTKKNGLGLGLSIAKWIVEAHRGHILAENELNGGATFRFTLPSDTAAAGQA
jgi:PAS domain S-box-containing protein